MKQRSEPINIDLTDISSTSIVSNNTSLNEPFSLFLAQTYEQHKIRIDLPKPRETLDHTENDTQDKTSTDLQETNKTLGHATILYHILHNSVIPVEYQSSIQELLTQLLPLDNSKVSTRKKEFSYSFRRSYDKNHYQQYYQITRTLIAQSQIKELFLNILLEKDENWFVIANDIRSVKPNGTKEKSLGDKFDSWMNNKITQYHQQINQFYNKEHTEFIHFIVACKIYLERIHHRINAFPLSANSTNEELNKIFNELLTHPTANLKFKQASGVINLPKINSEDNYPNSTFGREIITHFMEHVQIQTPKYACTSYKDIMTSPLLIKKILNSLNNDKHSGSFFQKIYINTVPCTPFRPLYIKSLINTLRVNGEQINSIFDPCGGWGGTMLGATISNISYIVDNDPNLSLIEPKKAMEAFLLKNTPLQPPPQYQLIQNDIRTSFNHSKFMVDMICTSPPFFDREQYDPENLNQTQSRTSRNYAQWVEDFIPKYITNSTSYLRAGGIFALQVTNVKGYDLIKDFLQKIISSKLFHFLYDIAPYSINYTSNAQPSYFFIFKKLGTSIAPYNRISLMPNELKLELIPAEDNPKNAQKEKTSPNNKRKKNSSKPHDTQKISDFLNESSQYYLTLANSSSSTSLCTLSDEPRTKISRHHLFSPSTNTTRELEWIPRIKPGT